MLQDPDVRSLGDRVAWQSEDGRSKLYAADARATLKALPENSVDCVWTDPPYLLSNDGVTCVAGRRVSVNKGDWDQSQGIELDHAREHTI